MDETTPSHQSIKSKNNPLSLKKLEKTSISCMFKQGPRPNIYADCLVQDLA